MKLSNRKQLLSEADAELKQIKDLVLEGRRIQETFKKKVSVNEFSPMGEINTALEVWLDGVDRQFMTDYISEGNRNLIVKRILDAIKKVAAKYNGKVVGKYSPVIIEWDYEMDQSEFDKIYNELKTDVEKLFNTNLFEFYTRGFSYKATGVFGTSISKGKIIKQYLGRERPSDQPQDSSFGEGDKYRREYRKFLDNLLSTRSRFDNKKFEYKIGEIISTYFAQNPQAVTRKTDWLKEIKPQIEKMFERMFK